MNGEKFRSKISLWLIKFKIRNVFFFFFLSFIFFLMEFFLWIYYISKQVWPREREWVDPIETELGSDSSDSELFVSLYDFFLLESRILSLFTHIGPPVDTLAKQYWEFFTHKTRDYWSCMYIDWWLINHKKKKYFQNIFVNLKPCTRHIWAAAPKFNVIRGLNFLNFVFLDQPSKAISGHPFVPARFPTRISYFVFSLGAMSIDNFCDPPRETLIDFRRF